jgi:O-methyltransferase
MNEANDPLSSGQPAVPGLRARLSRFINARLNRIGYALVRIDNKRQIPSSVVDGARFAYDNVTFVDVLAPWLVDEPFLQIWRKAASHSLTDIYRGYELYQCVREIGSIAGDILEVGVWRGGTGAVLAAGAARWKPASRLWLCDTFSGVVKAGAMDTVYAGGEHADTSVEIVAELLRGLRLTNAEIAKGIFPEETADRLGDAQIALCHIDVDVYQSAVDIVNWLMPRMPSGGMLLFDDYGFSTCKGITRFVDELRTRGDWIYVYNLNKHAVLIRR